MHSVSSLLFCSAFWTHRCLEGPTVSPSSHTMPGTGEVNGCPPRPTAHRRGPAGRQRTAAGRTPRRGTPSTSGPPTGRPLPGRPFPLPPPSPNPPPALTTQHTANGHLASGSSVPQPAADPNANPATFPCGIQHAVKRKARLGAPRVRPRAGRLGHQSVALLLQVGQDGPGWGEGAAPPQQGEGRARPHVGEVALGEQWAVRCPERMVTRRRTPPKGSHHGLPVLGRLVKLSAKNIDGLSGNILFNPRYCFTKNKFRHMKNQIGRNDSIKKHLLAGMPFEGPYFGGCLLSTPIVPPPPGGWSHGSLSPSAPVVVRHAEDPNRHSDNCRTWPHIHTVANALDGQHPHFEAPRPQPREAAGEAAPSARPPPACRRGGRR